MEEISSGSANELEKVLDDKITQGLNSSSRLPLLGSGHEIYSINSKYGAVNKNFRNRLFGLMQTVLASGGFSLNTHPNDMGELSKSMDFLLDRCAVHLDAYENNEKVYNVQTRDMAIKNDVCLNEGRYLNGGRYLDLSNKTKPDESIKNAGDASLNVNGSRYSDVLNGSKTEDNDEKRSTMKYQSQFKASVQYTKEFSRVDCRFDQREIKVDENRPQIEARFKQLFGENLKMIVGTSISSIPILPFKSLKRRQKVIKKRSVVGKLIKKLKSWATPYDSYLVQMAEKQTLEPPKKRKKSEHKKTT